MIIPLRTCCYVFTLKQGTMLIAVIELLMSAITLFLLLLASAHAQEIAAMLQADIQENSAGTSYYYLDADDTSVHVLPHHLSNNEIRLHRGQHVALVMIIGLYAAIAITTIHLISCMLLLYGSIMHIRQFLLPWLSVVMIGLVFTLAGLLVCVILGHATPMIALLTGLYIQQRLFLLVVVFSHYRRLYAEWSASCASAVQRDALSIKAGFMHFPPPNKPSDV